MGTRDSDTEDTGAGGYMRVNVVGDRAVVNSVMTTADSGEDQVARTSCPICRQSLTWHVEPSKSYESR